MNKISDAAVEAATRAIYFAGSPDATEAEYIDDSVGEDAGEVRQWMRAALEAALPHLNELSGNSGYLGDARAQFEAWSRNSWPNLDLSRGPLGDYMLARVRSDWELWQAATSYSMKP